MAERARSGLGRTLIDRDHAALRDHERHQVGDRVAALWRRDIADRCEAMSSAFSALRFLHSSAAAAIERVRRRRAARGTGEMSQPPGRADGDTGIAGLGGTHR